MNCYSPGQTAKHRVCSLEHAVLFLPSQLRLIGTFGTTLSSSKLIACYVWLVVILKFDDNARTYWSLVLEQCAALVHRLAVNMTTF